MIDEHTSVIGAHCTMLLPSERDLIGCDSPTEAILYPKVVIANHQVVSAQMRSRAINSCILYNSEEHYCYGIVQKSFVFQDSGTMKCLLQVNCLDPAPLKVCDDQVTHANLKKHFITFYPPQ